jgi:hypothetical protein
MNWIFDSNLEAVIAIVPDVDESPILAKLLMNRVLLTI